LDTSAVYAENPMSKHFRILVIALAMAGWTSGAALAGPSKDNGDPEIPTSPHRLLVKSSGTVSDGSGAQVRFAAGSVESERSDLWMRLLRTYLRFARVVGP
jgi:hypothetical protein